MLYSIRCDNDGRWLVRNGYGEFFFTGVEKRKTYFTSVEYPTVLETLGSLFGDTRIFTVHDGERVNHICSRKGGTTK